MHGLIHVILKQLVLEKFSSRAWAEILEAAGQKSDGPLMEMRQYEDSLTVKVVSTAAQVLGVSVQDALRAFGSFFAEYVALGGHLRVLESMGDTLEDFMRNINHLHFVLERGFRSSTFPYFKIGDAPGNADLSDEVDWRQFRLEYSSARGKLLAPVVEGVLPMLAQIVHGERVTMKAVQPEEGFNAAWIVTTEREVPPVGSAVVVVSQGLIAVGAADTPVAKHSAGKVASIDDRGDFHIDFNGHKASLRVSREDLRHLRMVREQKTAAEAKEASTFGRWWHQALVSIGSCCVTEMDKDSNVVTFGRASATDTVTLDDMIGGLSKSLAGELDTLARRAAASPDPAGILMRGVSADKIAAGWDCPDRLDIASHFWSTNNGQASDYQLSKSVDRATLFVTHCWAAPLDWHDVMGARCAYGDMKATELKVIADDLAEDLGCRWQDVTFWVDKCCIPQRHELMRNCIGLLEDFVQRCEGMVVLLSWNYFSRLWCVYEWATFLVYHDADSVLISVDNFLRPDTRGFYISSIEAFSMANACCHQEADRRTLQKKVARYYVSEAAFERFARCTAVAVMAATGARRASRGQDAYEEDFLPWASLAERLDEEALADKLRRADPLAWRVQAQEQAQVTGHALGSAARTWQGLFARKVDRWFELDVMPELDRTKQECVQPEILRLMAERRRRLGKRKIRRGSLLT